MTGPHSAIDDVGAATLGIDVFLENLAWPECDDTTGRNADFLSGPRIATLTGALAPYDKISESRNLDRFSLLQDGLQHIQHKFNNIGCFIFRNTHLLENFVRDIGLPHAIPPTRSPASMAPISAFPILSQRVLLKLREVMNPVKNKLGRFSSQTAIFL
jgi:hypothetical protein